tara:strand:+ start:1547 stop:1804 length:258 start_codon:yes stop_codon:yes gene_type:complete
MKDIIVVDAARREVNVEVAKTIPLFTSVVDAEVAKGIRMLLLSLDSPKLTKADKMNVRRAICIAKHEYPVAYATVIEAFGRDPLL